MPIDFGVFEQSNHPSATLSHSELGEAGSNYLAHFHSLQNSIGHKIWGLFLPWRRHDCCRQSRRPEMRLGVKKGEWEIRLARKEFGFED